MRTINNLVGHFQDTDGMTAIVSGAFNPVRLGHIELVRAAASFEPQHLIVFPNDFDPRKLCQPLKDRIRWVRLAIEEVAPDLSDRIIIADDPVMAGDLSAFTELLEENRTRVMRIVGDDKPIEVVSLGGKVLTKVTKRQPSLTSTRIRNAIRAGDTENLEIPKGILDEVVAAYQNRNFVLRRAPSNLQDIYIDMIVKQIIELQRSVPERYNVRVLDDSTVARIIRSGDMFFIVDDSGILITFYLKNCGQLGDKQVYKFGGLTTKLSEIGFIRGNFEKMAEQMILTCRMSYPGAVIIGHTSEIIARYARKYEYFQEECDHFTLRNKYPALFALYMGGRREEANDEKDTLRFLIHFPE